MSDNVPAHGFDLDHALRAFQEQNGVKVVDQTARVSFRFPHPDVRVLQLLRESPQTRPGLRQDLRRLLNGIGWQYSEADDANRHLAYVAPMLYPPVPVVAYHATRSAVVSSIVNCGLLPSNSTISATGRPDCFGNIYVCAELGESAGPSDVEPRKGTAMWWRWQLSRRNRFNDPDWVVLSVVLQGLAARVYRDIWSATGLIVDGIERIPPDRIAVDGDAGTVGMPSDQQNGCSG